MTKINKDFNVKIISLLVAVLFLFNSTVYGIDASAKSHLRMPLTTSNDEGRQRLTKALGHGDNVIKTQLSQREKHIIILMALGVFL